MTVKPLINQLEMRFWNKAIPLMQNSSPVRTILPWMYNLISKLRRRKTIFTIFACVLSGGSVGFLLGVVSQFL